MENNLSNLNTSSNFKMKGIINTDGASHQIM